MGGPRSSRPLVGRTEQVRALRHVVARAAEGLPTVVLVGGDAGVGKTRLLTHVAEVAQDEGAVVVVAHCVDLAGAAIPYLPFSEALVRLRTQGDTVDDVLRSHPALARLLPGAAPAPVVPGEPDAEDRLGLFDALGACLDAVGRPGHPLVLILEDLHWADASTRDLLRFLAARLHDQHVVLVGSYRTDDLHRRHPLRPVLAELWRLPQVERVDVEPFTAEELGTFAATVDPHLPGATVRRVLERSGGNAYFAEELLAAGEDPALPWTLGEVLRSRVETLDADVQELARVASVGGSGVGEALLRAVHARRSGAETPLDPVVRRAADARVLTAHADRLVFRHALLAEAVYDDLLPGERTTLHRLYRDALLADPSLGSPAQLAHHALRSGDVATALRASLDAAEDARRRLAPRAELDHLETALRLWDTVPGAAATFGRDAVVVAAAAADAAGRAGLDERAVALLRDAIDAADGDAALRGALRAALAEHLMAMDRMPDAVLEATEALAALPIGTRGRAHALALRARAAMYGNRPVEARASADEAVAQARELGAVEIEVDALITAAMVTTHDAAGRARLLADAGRRAREGGDRLGELRCGFTIAVDHFFGGRLAEAAVACQGTLERATAVDLQWSSYGAQALMLQQVLRFELGDLSPAPALPGDPPPGCALLLQAAALPAAAARGDDDVVARATALRPQWERDGSIAHLAALGAAEALIWAGRCEDAAALAEEALAVLDATWPGAGIEQLVLGTVALAGRAGVAVGARAAGADPAEQVSLGTRMLARVERYAEDFRGDAPLDVAGSAWLARARAEHARLVGDDDPEPWRAATQALGYGFRYEEARCRWRWAQASLTGGDRAGARERGRAALDAATAMGARPLAAAIVEWARHARLDLQSAGDGEAAASPLTDREIAVLTLAAQGLTNREIGARLFISGKTASVHLSNVMAKLGARSRTEAVTVAHLRGLLPSSPAPV